MARHKQVVSCMDFLSKKRKLESTLIFFFMCFEVRHCEQSTCLKSFVNNRLFGVANPISMSIPSHRLNKRNKIMFTLGYLPFYFLKR